ncbi:DNA starvation/stationary phase protection protein [Nitrososphaera sp.]|uniref:Dps family protein n=1 Tax=Nitrososphaera sp. TaxID=1971748 RepID=UPI00307DBD5E
MASSSSSKGKKSPDIGLGSAGREGTIKILSALLADEYLLYTKTRNYHWNVVGPRFQQLHEFFKAQYTQLDVIVDDVAERIPQLGGKAPATLGVFAKNSRLEEDSAIVADADEMLSNLLGDHEAVIRNLRKDSETVMDKYGDSGTNDFLIGLMEQHEKMAWMIRAHIEGSGSSK